MLDELSTAPLILRLATTEDIEQIERLDGFSTSPTRHIHRDMEKYFGSVDPSTHERTLIFLAEVNGILVAKAELMLPAKEIYNAIGYVKRVIVHPDFRNRGLAKQLMQRIIIFANSEQHLEAIDLHVWEGNHPAIRLYEDLGFQLQHQELYYRLPLE
jgi:ribosomal protein S18 acetylase RimI-like enzyme